MRKKIVELFKKREPYWNDFFLKHIPGPSAQDGFDAVMQNIASESLPFETRENVRAFLNDILPVPGEWDASQGKIRLGFEGEKIEIEVGLSEKVSGVTVSVECFGPPKHAVEITNAIQSKYQLKVSGMGTNPHVA